MSLYSDSVVKRLNFGPDAATPLSKLAQRQCAQARLPASASRGVIKSGSVRYGLPEDELPRNERPGSTRSVSYRAPSDDEDDSDSEATSGLLPDTVSRPDVVAGFKRQLQQQMLASLESAHLHTQAKWRSRLAEVESQLTAKLSALSIAALRKQDDLEREDQELLQRQRQQRNEVLERMQSTHRTEASRQEQQVKRFVEQREEERRQKEEEERRQKEEEERRQEQIRREAEQERKRKEEEEERERKHKEEAEARSRQEAEARRRQEAEVENKRREADAQMKKEAAASAAKDQGLRVSPLAQQQASQLAARLTAVQAAVQQLLSDESSKKQRRDLEKKLTVHVQQISGTQDQVQAKCQDVYNLLSNLQGVWRSFAVITLCNKIIKQHELVQRNHKAAFPLALVVVKVSNFFPELLELLIALIHKGCPLAIPRSYVHDPTKGSNSAYYRRMGFEEQDDPSAPSGKVFETPEEYAQRLEGLMLLYGALMQVDDPNPHGLQHAWSYVARALNHLPADRYTAKALISVLHTAGYSMHLRFRGQFVKLMAAMQREFLPALRRAAGDDIGALATVLDSYVSDGMYRRVPEGRNMPKFDISSIESNRG